MFIFSVKLVTHRVDWDSINKHITSGSTDKSKESRIWNKPDFGKFSILNQEECILKKI